jgi:hypothetical protein
MGFIYIKSSVVTRVLWNNFFHHLMKQKGGSDDQRDFNLLLMRAGLKYSKPPKVFINSIAVAASAGPGTSRAGSGGKIPLIRSSNINGNVRSVVPTKEEDEEVNVGEAEVLLPSNSSNRSTRLLKVVLLPHAKYRRTCYPTRRPYSPVSTARPQSSSVHEEKAQDLSTDATVLQSVVAHCAGLKRNVEVGKRLGVSNAELWLLRPQWRSVPANGTGLENYLDDIANPR